MLKNTLLLLLLFCTQSYALDLFKAQYHVFKDGKEIGSSSIELKKQDNYFSIIDQTKGTHGMASFLGFKRTEVTDFFVKDDGLIPELYQMEQKVAFKKRRSNYQVDDETQMVYGEHKGKAWQIKLPKDFSTPNLVSLRLAEDVCANKTENLNYNVLKRGELVNYQFTIISQKDNIIEVEKVHAKPSRITKTWLDTNQHCISVKTYHAEEGEDPLESKLMQVTFFN